MKDWNVSIESIFTEVFGGKAAGEGGTWFVEGGQALDETLATLSAEQASFRASDRVSSVAAHVIHTAYYLELAVDRLKGTEREGDWEGSWARQVVSESEWEEILGQLKALKAEFLRIVKIGEFEGYGATELVANVAHAAYHLGAIRQLVLLIP